MCSLYVSTPHQTQWTHIMMSTRSKFAQPRNQRVEKDLFPVVGTEDMGVTSRVVLSLNNWSMGLLFRKPIHLPMQKHLRGKCIPVVGKYLKKDHPANSPQQHWTTVDSRQLCPGRLWSHPGIGTGSDNTIVLTGSLEILLLPHKSHTPHRLPAINTQITW